MINLNQAIKLGNLKRACHWWKLELGTGFSVIRVFVNRKSGIIVCTAGGVRPLFDVIPKYVIATRLRRGSNPFQNSNGRKKFFVPFQSLDIRQQSCVPVAEKLLQFDN